MELGKLKYLFNICPLPRNHRPLYLSNFIAVYRRKGSPEPVTLRVWSSIPTTCVTIADSVINMYANFLLVTMSYMELTQTQNLSSQINSFLFLSNFFIFCFRERHHRLLILQRQIHEHSIPNSTFHSSLWLTRQCPLLHNVHIWTHGTYEIATWRGKRDCADVI